MPMAQPRDLHLRFSEYVEERLDDYGPEWGEVEG